VRRRVFTDDRQKAGISAEAPSLPLESAFRDVRIKV
jgi:hypothetical protein